MSQKRSKNQIRRQRVKLRKLAENKDAKSPKSSPGKLEGQLAKSEGLVRTSASTLKARNVSDQKAIVDEGKEVKSGKKDESVSGIVETSAEDLDPENGPKSTANTIKEASKESVSSLKPVTEDTSFEKSRKNGAKSSSDKVAATAIKENNADVESRKGSEDGSSIESTNGNPSLDRSSDDLSLIHKPKAEGISNHERQNQEQQPNKEERGKVETLHRAQVTEIFSRLTEALSPEPSIPPIDNDLMAQYSDIFHKFGPKTENQQQQQIVMDSGAGNESSDASSSSEIECEDIIGIKQLSKRQKRLREKIPISVLKASTSKPQAVEWYDADAPDPCMVVHLKTTMNHVNVPLHWQQKKEYLSLKKGVERLPFVLPKFIENTGIAEMRNHDAESLKKLQRDRMQPKIGRLDIDYQKLHDAFFKHQTKPQTLPFGEVYCEGREKMDQYREDVALMRPGRISMGLRLAVGMSESETIAPPWITVMQDVGKPPSYMNLNIPGIDTDYTNLGYLIQYGKQASAVDLLRDTWGSLEDGEESDSEPELEELETEIEYKPESAVVSDDEDQPEMVEIAEYSKIKTSSSVSSAATAPASLGKLYTIFREKAVEPSGALVGGKQRYELERKGEESPAKRHQTVSHKLSASGNADEFKF